MRYESEKTAKGNTGISYESQEAANAQAVEMDKNNCSYCSGCCDCRDCSYCCDYKSNPERIVSPVLGSRQSQTTIYFLTDNIQVVCGCFRGNLEQLQEAVTNKYGTEHEYHTWINRVKTYINY